MEWWRIERRVGRFLLETLSESELEKSSSLLGSLYEIFVRVRWCKSWGAMSAGAIYLDRIGHDMSLSGLSRAVESGTDLETRRGCTDARVAC